MQFKRVKNRIQVLAYDGYDREKRRAIVRLKGSLDRYTLQPTDGLLDCLTEEQKNELQSYIDNVRQSRKKSSRQSAILYGYSQIQEIADSLTDDETEVTAENAGKLFAAISNLEKALRKAGFKKSDFKEVRQSSSEKNDNQPGLFQ